MYNFEWRQKWILINLVIRFNEVKIGRQYIYCEPLAKSRHKTEFKMWKQNSATFNTFSLFVNTHLAGLFHETKQWIQVQNNSRMVDAVSEVFDHILTHIWIHSDQIAVKWTHIPNGYKWIKTKEIWELNRKQFTHLWMLRIDEQKWFNSNRQTG